MEDFTIRRLPQASQQLGQPEAETEQSLVGKLSSGVVSGLGMVGNALDLPGSMVRDAVTWLPGGPAAANPFDQLLSPLSGENRTDGRTMMEQFGMRPNKETGWVPLEDPGEFARDVIGFGAELALDPLGWATGWMSSAAGKGAKAISLAGKAGQAAKPAGRISRAMSATGKVIDTLDPGFNIGRAAHNNPASREFIQKYGGKMRDGLGSRIDKALGGARAANKWADNVDPTDGKIKRSGSAAVRGANRAFTAAKVAKVKVGERLTEAFDKRANSAVNAPVQEGAIAASRIEKSIMNEFGGEYYHAFDEIRELSKDTPVDELEGWMDRFSKTMRTTMESKLDVNAKNFPDMPESMHLPLQRIKTFMNEKLQVYAKQNNMNLSVLQDEMVDHLHRQMMTPVKNWISRNDPGSVGGSGARPMGVTNSQVHGKRSQMLKDGETNAFNDVTSDPQAHALADQAHAVKDDPKAFAELMTKVRDRIEEVAGGRILRDAKAMDKGEQNFKMLNDAGVPELRTGAALNKLNYDPRIQVGDTVQWTVNGQWFWANGRKIQEIITNHGVNEIPPMAKFFDEATQGESYAPMDQLSHWDDATKNTADASKTRRVEQSTRPVLDATGTPKVDVDGNVVMEDYTKTLTHQMDDRFQQLADHIYNRPIYKETGGIFTNPFHSMQTGVRAFAVAVRNSAATTHVLKNGFGSGDAFGKGILQMPSEVRGHAMTLDKLFDMSSFTAMDRRAVYDEMLSSNPDLVKAMDDLGPEDILKTNEDDEFLDLEAIHDYMGTIRIDPEIAEDMNRAWEFKATADSPGVAGSVENAFRSFTAMFKTGVLTHQARYIRDGVTGQIQNMTHGIFSYDSMKSMFNVLFNRSDEGLLQFDEVTEFMRQRGMDATGENATKAVRQMYSARHGHSSSIYHDVDNLDTSVDAARDFASITDTLPGNPKINGVGDLIKELFATAMGRRGGDFNPLNIAGVNRRRETTLAPVQAGNLIGKYFDDSNRLVGFIESMRQGKSADEAMAIVDRVQLNYDPRTFTPTEQALKRFFPFYSFFSREAKYLSNELWTNPAGRLGKLIRLQRHGSESSQDEFLPEHVRSKMAIPLGDSNDGGRTFLTGMGLMHEDVLSDIAGGLADPQQGMRSALSMMNPLIKGFAEFGLGRSSFQGGPMGGRDLDDMDPVLGRIATQLGLKDEAPGGGVSPLFGSRALEFAASNSPISRILSTVKNLGDTRKTYAQNALRFMSGVQITTVSPEQARYGLRALGNKIARDAGARSFETFSIADELAEDVKSRTPEKYEKVKATKDLRDLWNRESRIERKSAGNMLDVDDATLEQYGVKTDQDGFKKLTNSQAERHQEWIDSGRDVGTPEWAREVFTIRRKKKTE